MIKVKTIKWNRLSFNVFISMIILIVCLCLMLISLSYRTTEASLSQTLNEQSVCKGGSMNIVAHEDDDILFMNPDIQHDLTSGKCVTTVYITTGAYSTGPLQTNERENGPKAAYAKMAGVPNLWIESRTQVNEYSLLSFRLKTDTNVNLIYMRLPNSQENGEGWSFYAYQTLQALYQRNLERINAVDGSAEYSRQSLISTLISLIQVYRPSIIRTQDFLAPFSSGDHSDHVAVARFVEDASTSILYPHSMIAYYDYDTAKMLVNLSHHDIIQKGQAWNAYAPYDPSVCQSYEICRGFQSDYYRWLEREYIATTITTT